MAKKVSIINMKGGVGKSTLCINFAWHFAAMVKWLKKVLVVDLDPQFNASQYLLGVTAYNNIITNNIPTIWDIFEQFTQLPGIPRPSSLNPSDILYRARTFHGGGIIDLIPSRLELAFSLRNPGQKDQLLEKFVSQIENNYDMILLDCPPTESLFTWAAYLTSDYILVPVKPEYLSSIGLPLLVNSMQEFGRRYEGNQLGLAGIVFNATSGYVPEEITAKNEVRQIAQQNGWYVFSNEVSYSRSYPKGAREGQPIFRTSYSRSDQCARFRTVAEEFAQRIGL
ncbi:ParA family protein [Chloroflexota bacterium]